MTADHRASVDVVRDAATAVPARRERWFQPPMDPAQRRRATRLRALLRGDSSPEVVAAVSRCIATLPPDDSPRLREKVLQSADLSMRAARIAGSSPGHLPTLTPLAA